MNTYIVESWRPDTADGSAKVSCRIMSRQWNPHTTEHEWRYKRHTFSEWDWELDPSENEQRGVVRTVRMDIQKDPLEVAYGGETVRGKLWIVTVTS